MKHMSVTKLEDEGSEEDRQRKIRETIAEVLRGLLGEQCDAIVIFAATGDRVVLKYVGTPAEIFNLALQGHENVMEAFKFDAAKPLPGHRLN